MTEIRELIEAVEAGTLPVTNWRCFDVFPASADPGENAIYAHRAYHGSVDAALSLMAAVLPKWRVLEIRQLSSGEWLVRLEWRESGPVAAIGGNLGRTMLLAELRAMEAQQ